MTPLRRQAWQIEQMIARAYVAQGWGHGDGVRARPPAADVTERLRRAHAEGVEAALIWVLGRSNDSPVIDPIE